MHKEDFYNILEQIRFNEYISDDEWESFCHQAAGMNPAELDQIGDSVLDYWKTGN